MFLSFTAVDQHVSSLVQNLYSQAVEDIGAAGFSPPVETHVGNSHLLDKIKSVGMVMQHHFDQLDYFWHSTNESKVLVAWPPYHMHGLEIIGRLREYRGDEIAFETLDVDQHISYAVGHPRAMITWAVTLSHAQVFQDPWPCSHSTDSTSTARMVWWAQRINLKVYSAR